MMPPWEVLGVERGCSQSDLKRAYARLLKLHRPDQDPEGFRRIRDAFEWLRTNEEILKVIPIQPDAPPQSLAELDQDKTAAESFGTEMEATQKPIEGSAPERNSLALSPSFKEGDEKISANAGTASNADVIPIFDFKAKLEEAHEFAMHEKWPQTGACLEAIKNEMLATSSAEGAGALVMGAALIALLNWRHAQKLVDAAYPHLASYHRDRLLAELDMLIQAGKEIDQMHQSQRSVLCRCIAARSVDRNQPIVNLALREMLSIPRATTAREYFRERFPNLQIKPRKVQVVKPRPAQSTSSSSGSGYGRLPWFLFLIVSSMFRLLSSCNSTPSSDYDRPAYVPHRVDNADTERTRINNAEIERILNQKNRSTNGYDDPMKKLREQMQPPGLNKRQERP